MFLTFIGSKLNSVQSLVDLGSSGLGSPENIHLQQVNLHFNAQVSPQDMLKVETVPPHQSALSQKIDTHIYQSLLSSASPVNKARLPAVSLWFSCWLMDLVYPFCKLELTLTRLSFR